MNVLNLYCGIGGNRKLWPSEINVTAVEIDQNIAKIYKDFFPNDNIVIGDAHEYLLKHYKEFDFIWSSPPCPTHSNTNRFLNAQGVYRYPDMTLYQEIILLKEFYKGLWVVENVIPYYEPLIKPQYSGRHCFWCNFTISQFRKNPDITVTNSRASTRRGGEEHLKSLEQLHGFNLSKYPGLENRRKVLQNCVEPRLGKEIFDCAMQNKQPKLIP